MNEPILITSDDTVLKSLNFKPYRSKVERRVVPFAPAPGEPQTLEIDTPWGQQLTADRGDFLVSEINAPGDYWPVKPHIFDESYVLTRPGYCVKKALTWVVPMVDLTRGDPDQLVTVVSLEGSETVRAGDFYLARGVKGELWAYPKEKINEVMTPAE
jgi:hypothetical protein